MIGNGAFANSTSTYSVTFLSGGNKIASNSLVQNTITSPNSYQYYWFTVSVRNSLSQLLRWNHLIVLGGGNDTNLSVQREVDLYVSLFNGRLPTAEDCDLKAETNGPDYLNVNSDDAIFQNRTQLLQQGPNRVLFIVGVRGQLAGTSYTLLNWGPNLPTQNETFYSYTDLTIQRSTASVQFLPRATQDV